MKFTAICCAIGVTFAAQSATARSLCGESYQTTAGLEASLRASPGVRVFDRRSDITTIFSKDTDTLWWFAKVENRAYPAVACARHVLRNGAYVRLWTQYDCGQSHKPLCSALADRISKAKF